MGELRKAKRKRQAMETSTPTNLRRETKLIVLGESPIEGGLTEQDNKPDSIDGHGMSGTQRAGLSGEIDSMAVTPPKQVSPNTENRKLYKGARNIINAAAAEVRGFFCAKFD